MALRVTFRVRATKRSAGPPCRRATWSWRVSGVRRSSEETDSPVTMKTAALNAGPRARSPRERHARGHPHPGIRAQAG